jgi:5-(carboxyamino)imidazole ribonucleotide synthase
MAQRCVAISFENEWVPLAELEALRQDGIRFVPDLDALAPLTSKLQQRLLLDRLHLPAPRWCSLEAALPSPHTANSTGGESPGGLEVEAPPAPAGPSLPRGFRFPLMAKAATGGYDGRGTRVLREQSELESLIASVNPAEWILEERISFERELAMVACRDRHGGVECYPLLQTHQHERVCEWVQYPAVADHGVRAAARNVAASLLTALDYVGVLAIEFFYGPAGLLVNELAPRTHNSGHLTIEAFRCSQFEQQARIVAGLPMVPPEAAWPGALMVNLLGYETAVSDYAPQRRALAALPGAVLHWYGKRQARPGRKLGHITLRLESRSPRELVTERERRLAELRRIWPLPPGDPATGPKPLD